MKRSNFARAAAVTGIALGLGAFAVPAASADAIYNEKGDFAVQNAQTNGNNSPIAQAAQNDTDVKVEDVMTKIHDNATKVHDNALAGHDNKG